MFPCPEESTSPLLTLSLCPAPGGAGGPSLFQGSLRGSLHPGHTWVRAAPGLSPPPHTGVAHGFVASLGEICGS